MSRLLNLIKVTLVMFITLSITSINTSVAEESFQNFEESIQDRTSDTSLNVETKFIPNFDVSNPVDISIVIDVSGSMNDIYNGQTLMSQAKTAMQLILEQLKVPVELNKESVKFSIVTFGTKGHEHTKVSNQMSNDLDQLIESVEQISAELGRYTHIDAGLDLALSTFNINDDRDDIVVLISDGEPSEIEEAYNKAKKLKDNNVEIYGIKVGSLTDSYMKEMTSCDASLANEGDECVSGGDKYYMDLLSFDSFDTIFKNLWGILVPVQLTIPKGEYFTFDTEFKNEVSIIDLYKNEKVNKDIQIEEDALVWDHSILNTGHTYGISYGIKLDPSVEVGVYTEPFDKDIKLTYSYNEETHNHDIKREELNFGVSSGSINLSGLPNDSITPPNLRSPKILTGQGNDEFVIENIRNSYEIDGSIYNLVSIDYKAVAVAGEVNPNLKFTCIDQEDNIKSCKIENNDLGAANYTFNLNYETTDIKEYIIEKVYDGIIEEIDNQFIIEKFDLSDNAQIELLGSDKIIEDVVLFDQEIGYQENTYKINDGNNNFIGKIKVKINQRPLVIKAGSLDKIYDGDPLVYNKIMYDYQDLSNNTGLLKGQSIDAEVSGEITNVGSIENQIHDIKITKDTSASNRNLITNYTVTINNGTLNVFEETISKDSINIESDIPKFIYDSIDDQYINNPMYPYKVENGEYKFEYTNQDNNLVEVYLTVKDHEIKIQKNNINFILDIIILLISLILTILCIIKLTPEKLYYYNQSTNKIYPSKKGRYIYIEDREEYVFLVKKDYKNTRQRNDKIRYLKLISIIITVAVLLIFVGSLLVANNIDSSNLFRIINFVITLIQIVILFVTLKSIGKNNKGTY